MRLLAAAIMFAFNQSTAHSTFRCILHHVSRVVGKRFPESVFTSIGGIVFLRLINPAIVTPSMIDLDLPNESAELRRGLVTITKVLQALANNIRFGAKEPAMKALNGFMDRNIFPMTRFLQDVVRCQSVLYVGRGFDQRTVKSTSRDHHRDFSGADGRAGSIRSRRLHTRACRSYRCSSAHQSTVDVEALARRRGDQRVAEPGQDDVGPADQPYAATRRERRGCWCGTNRLLAARSTAYVSRGRSVGTDLRRIDQIAGMSYGAACMGFVRTAHSAALAAS